MTKARLDEINVLRLTGEFYFLSAFYAYSDKDLNMQMIKKH